jgi:hypothetical protein
MKNLVVVMFLAAIISGPAWMVTVTPLGAQSPTRPIPILVELFTSEGCSSCPPADALLEKLDRSQPVAGAELIVLSEHVDYWNHIGWTDPYSSHFYSERQSSYAQRFGQDGVYTPQMVVDGSSEFVGSDARLAAQALANAAKTPKIRVQLSAISVDGAKSLTARVETEALPVSYRSDGADVYLAIAFSHAESKVLRGENSGRRLTHTGVVRGLLKVGTLRPGQNFARDVQVKLEPGADPQNVRLIAFLQEPGAGPVLGATVQSISK